MSKTDNDELELYKTFDNFIDYENQKALFKTKMVEDMHHNGEIVEVIGLLKGKDSYNDRYIVKFNDGTINDNIMSVEIDFDCEKAIQRKTKNKNKDKGER